MEKMIRNITAIMLTMLLVLPSQAYAAEHDSTQDISSDTATIYIGKVLTVSQDNKFPGINDFNFTLTAVKAWDNANQDTTKSGEVIPVSEMPMPAEETSSHHTIRVNGTSAAVTVGDFRGTANTERKDSATERFRVTPANIRFTKAGYYMYKVTEQGSSPDKVPGVSYDPDSYYIVIYVCNNTDGEGNTVDGVYVHDITSYRNDPGSDYRPDLSDIQNITDNGGNAYSTNNYENLGKVGRSTPDEGSDNDTGLVTGPNKLEAYKFFNDHTTHDIVITNNVTGNLGDRTKEFEITVTLEGLEKNAEYTTDQQAQEKTEKNRTSKTADLVSASAGSINKETGKITADSDGKAEFLIKLADDEVFVINALPATSTYKAVEHESDHVASYSLSSTQDRALIVSASGANSKDQTAISTALETVDSVSNVPGRSKTDTNNDGTVTIAFVNSRNIATVTGIPYNGDYIYISIAAMAAAVLIIAAGRRRKTEENEM
ncbi:MAG: hypothetical protein E7220_00540 [Clostridiales bacterium]|nr:hypothetical protein [Clostridiales bacterium]